MNDGKVVYTAPERIDAKNKSKIAEELKALVKEGAEEIVVDMSKLKYISSAGLRILMDMEKQTNGAFEIMNVPANVKEILDMTGFSNILRIV